MIEEGLPVETPLNLAPHIRLVHASHTTDENNQTISTTVILHYDRIPGGATGIIYKAGQKEYTTPFQSPEKTIEIATRMSLLQSFGQEINPNSIPELRRLETPKQPNKLQLFTE